MAESVDDKPRLSGARGDFVASLGRRLQALRAALRALEEQPGDRARRNALLRRVHALGAAARVLGFASVAEALAEAERAIASTKQVPRPADLAEVSRVLDVVPSLVGGASPSLRPPGPAEAPGGLTGRQWPVSILLFGGQELELSLMAAVQRDSVEVERSEDVQAATESARVMGPDLVLLDADAPRAKEFFQQLNADELTEPVKSIFVGEFADVDQPRSLTVSGATRVLRKPVDSDTLRRTIEELTECRLEARDDQRPLGDLTVQKLAARIAQELEQGLVQATAPGTQATHVAFGQGSDVMAVVWGAVTRLRELVSLHSQGTVRFEPTGPEGAITLSPWIDTERRAGERGAPGAREELGVSLNGRRVIVADDDPAVAWFLSGLLKTVGAEVIEAYDGEQALELVRQRWPDLIVSDILMPKLDGFGLCREIKRDVAVRDVPVILLSWKEDLLQRMRELGADADGYLRKEAAASTIVQRIREVMRPRARVEARLRMGGEVRGRLDGLTPRLVLELCCNSRENLRVSFRDAFFSYTVQVRQGRLLSISRQREGAEPSRGSSALKSLLGVNAGRFLVVPDASPCGSEFEGKLPEVLAASVRHARECQRALSHERLPGIERIEFDPGELETYLGLTPDPLRAPLLQLAEGGRPAQLLLGGATPPELLVHTLIDMARRGIITRVVSSHRDEPIDESHEQSPASEPTPSPQPSIGPAETRTETTMNHADRSEPLNSAPEPTGFSFQLSPEVPPVERPSGGSHTKEGEGGTAASDQVLDDAAWFTSSLVEPAAAPPPQYAPGGPTLEAASSPSASEPSEAPTRTPPPVQGMIRAEPESADPLATTARIEPEAAPVGGQEHTPSEPLVAALLMKPSVAAEVDQEPVAPAELLPRTKPITFPGGVAHAARARENLPSSPAPPAERDAFQPAGKSQSEAPAAATLPEAADPGSGHNPPAAIEPEPRQVARRPEVRSATSGEQLERGDETPANFEQAALSPAPADPSPIQAPKERAPHDAASTLKVVGYALVAMVLSYVGMSALVAWLTEPMPSRATAQAGPESTAAALAAAAPASAAPAAPAKPAAGSTTPRVELLDLELPSGLALGADKGVLKIITPDAHTIYVDGEFAGRGPTRIVPIGPGKHEVKTRFEGEEHVFSAEVKAGRMTRLSVIEAGP